MADKQVYKIDEAPCVVCGADFRTSQLDENNRCPRCASLGLKTKAKDTPELVYTNDRINKDVLRSVVKELLDELLGEKKKEATTTKSKKETK